MEKLMRKGFGQNKVVFMSFKGLDKNSLAGFATIAMALAFNTPVVAVYLSINKLLRYFVTKTIRLHFWILFKCIFINGWN
jgi:Sec-independent protein secretion pathway component TatC